MAEQLTTEQRIALAERVAGLVPYRGHEDPRRVYRVDSLGEVFVATGQEWIEYRPDADIPEGREQARDLRENWRLAGELRWYSIDSPGPADSAWAVELHEWRVKTILRKAASESLASCLALLAKIG